MPVSKADLNDRVRALAATAEPELLRRLLDLYMDETTYLDEHAPSRREGVGRFECSGMTYHVPPCGNYGPKGNCGEGAPEPWCPVGGHDCSTCEMVDELEGILAREHDAAEGRRKGARS